MYPVIVHSRYEGVVLIKIRSRPKVAHQAVFRPNMRPSAWFGHVKREPAGNYFGMPYVRLDEQNKHFGPLWVRLDFSTIVTPAV